MTQEQKDLLLKDLCARLPYGVKCCIYNFGEDTIRIKEDILWSVQGDNILTLKSCVEKGEAYMFHQIKPYLFPMSSMTMDQAQQWHKYANDRGGLAASTDWLNAHHFDYRGLIEKGLAIDATNKDIY